MDKLIPSDEICDSRSVVPLNLLETPMNVVAPLRSDQTIELPTEQAGLQAYVLDYFKGLRIPEEEASPLLGEILSTAKKRCEAILFFSSFTGAWQRLADWLTLAMQNAALESYIWHQRDNLIERLRKNRRYWQDAEDIADNVMSEAITAVRRGRRPKTTLKNWLSVVARNTLINHHRRERIQPRTIRLFHADNQPDDSPLLQKLPDPGLSPCDQAVCRITWEELAAMKGKEVADACRYTAQGYTQKEIAQKCGASQRTVRRWLEKAAAIERLFKETG